MADSVNDTCWSLEQHNASISSPGFGAVIDVLNPSSGLSEIQYRGSDIEGCVLGISPSEHSIDGPDEVADVYVRGTDLVVTYKQTEKRPFALQVYWRVSSVDEGVVQLDAIVSLQTCLLESFPLISTSTKLPSEIAANELQVGMLLRGADSEWSYAERVQTADSGESPAVDASSGDNVCIARELGGQFLEKGVIRRLRLRGLFLPRENDRVLADKYLAGLETEELPLTV